MKKLHLKKFALALLLAFTVLFSLTSCGDGYYKPIRSSSLERTVVAEMGDHKVNYELIRFLFMSRIDQYDDGDRSRWSTDEATTLWDTAMADILPYISDIYAVFDICTSWGIDPEGDNIDDAVNEYIKADIDGGDVGNYYVDGYGSVDAYRDELSRIYCTDAVRRLLYRYSACLASLYSYVAVNGAEGRVAPTDAQLSDFLTGDECAHVNHVYIPFLSQLGNTIEERKASALQRITKILTDVQGVTDYSVLINKAFCYSYSSQSMIAGNEQIDSGLWFGKYSTDRDYSERLYETIFSIEAGEWSDIIETDEGYYIVYGMNCDATPLSDSNLRETIKTLWAEELYSKQITEQATILLSQITYKKAFSDLNGSALINGK